MRHELKEDCSDLVYIEDGNVLIIKGYHLKARYIVYKADSRYKLCYIESTLKKGIFENVSIRKVKQS